MLKTGLKTGGDDDGMMNLGAVTPEEARRARVRMVEEVEEMKLMMMMMMTVLWRKE